MTLNSLIAALQKNADDYTTIINNPATDADERRRLTLVRDAYRRDVVQLSALRADDPHEQAANCAAFQREYEQGAAR